MYCPRCGYRSDAVPPLERCPRCASGGTSPARARPPSLGRSTAPRERRGFSRGFKLTLAGIGLFVLIAALLPFVAPPPRSRSPSQVPRAPSRDTLVTEDAPSLAPPAAGGRTPVPTPEEVERVPELPVLDASTATPALLARAIELSKKHPDEAWLREYVVNTHYWLARRSNEARRFAEALRYLDGSEEWGALPGDVATFRAMVYRDQQTWEPAERWARTALELRSTIDPAEMHHVVGLSRYFHEDLDRAIEELETALAMKDAPHIRASLELALRDRRVSDGRSPRRLSHFIVRYEGESMEDIGRTAIDRLERSYASLASQLGFEPAEPIAVILYTNESYREINGSDRHRTAGMFDGKIRLPVRGVRWSDEHILRIVHHELAHAFYHSRTRGRGPRWLNEGLAEYVTGQRTIHLGGTLAPLLRDNRTLEGCLLRSLYECDVFYPAAASLVDYTVQLRGMGGIRDILSDLGEGDPVDDALRRQFGRDQAALIRDWEHFIRRRH